MVYIDTVLRLKFAMWFVDTVLIVTEFAVYVHYEGRTLLDAVLIVT